VSSGPIYWIGEQAGITYELTKTTDGRVFVRYLPVGVPAGSTQAYLTIGTYPVANAYSVVRQLAQKSGMIKLATKKGVAFYNQDSPTNVYMAYPGSNYEIEVFDPSASRAQLLAASGKLSPVIARKTGTTTATANGTTPAAMKALERKVNHIIYWAGPVSGDTYELSRTAGGSVYLRYLPAGVPVGSSKPYTTIGSYPVANAYAATKALSERVGSIVINVGGGGVAFYNLSRPTNVYLAYPGENVQVEVYDPSPSHAHELVASLAITPVP